MASPCAATVGDHRGALLALRALDRVARQIPTLTQEGAARPAGPRVTPSCTRNAALPLYRRALGIEERVRGPDHPAVAAALLSVAEAELTLGDPATALPRVEHALAIGEPRGETDTPLADTRFLLAVALNAHVGASGAQTPAVRPGRRKTARASSALGMLRP